MKLAKNKSRSSCFIKTILMVFLLAILLIGCAEKEYSDSERDSSSNDRNSIKEEDLIGTYLGENGSILVLHPDGIADYYKYGDSAISTDNTWKIQNGRIKIDITAYHCTVKGKLDDPDSFYLESDSVLWENSSFGRIDDEMTNLSTEDCDNILAEYLDIDVEEYTSQLFDGIEYLIPSYLLFSVGDDKSVIYSSDDESLAWCFICGDMGTSTYGYQTIRNALSISDDSIYNEGDITIAGLPGYYIETNDVDIEGIKGKGVIVFFQHDGKLDLILGSFENDNDSERSKYTADFFNMLGTASLANGNTGNNVGSNSGTNTGGLGSNTSQSSGNLYRITNSYIYCAANAIGAQQYYGVVEIENTSSSNLLLKDCVFDLEDNNGHLLSTEDYINTCPSIIEPGEKGYFYNGIGGYLNDGVSTANGLVLKPTITVEPTNNSLTYYNVTDTSGSWSILGTPEFTGRVTNQTSSDASEVKLYVLMFDENDRAIAITSSRIDDLRAGETRSFSISGLIGITPEVGSSSMYTIVATDADSLW